MHNFSTFYSPYATGFTPSFANGFLLGIMPLLIIATVLKGYALWHAARSEQKWWFIALLVVNTLGILEIIYLLWFRPTSPYHHSRRSHTPAHDSSAQA